MTANEQARRKTGLDVSQWQTTRAKISLHRVFPRFRVRPINVGRLLALARAALAVCVCVCVRARVRVSVRVWHEKPNHVLFGRALLWSKAKQEKEGV